MLRKPYMLIKKTTITHWPLSWFNLFTRIWYQNVKQEIKILEQQWKCTCNNTLIRSNAGLFKRLRFDKTMRFKIFEAFLSFTWQCEVLDNSLFITSSTVHYYEILKLTVNCTAKLLEWHEFKVICTGKSKKLTRA